MSQDAHTLPHRFAYGNAPQQFAELYLPPTSGPHPVVILLHGGFWRAQYGLTLMQGLASDLITRGFAAWNIEYRRVGEEGGGWPGTFSDVAHATDYLRTIAIAYSLDLARVVPVGHSAGGHLALWLAARRHLPSSEITSATPLLLAAAVSLAGVNDLEQAYRLHLGNDAAMALLNGSPDDYPTRYQLASPAARLPLGIPQILVHGTADDRVPFIVSQDYVAHASQAGDPVTLIELPGADHFVVIDPTSSAWQTTVAQMQEALHL